MPRERTHSAIQKSLRNNEQKAEICQESARRASRKYRRKNKEKHNQASKLRMRNEREKLSNDEADAKERCKMSAKKYYLKNREAILAKAEHKRVKYIYSLTQVQAPWALIFLIRAYVSKHNDAEWAYFAYPARKYNLRVGLIGEKDATDFEEGFRDY
ncbi:hypothetical protein C8R41DRAFT_868284 [Lentinula lateritia]|uniref:Uncharacterized protein n=1 Tax=Lentinula lateritia TaxID=40482 RepID=A0ABQ8VFQ4_9AGAR|nr:hypothetical protein C8R41DRAFT_868284 [Lentinula lateritia]